MLKEPLIFFFLLCVISFKATSAHDYCKKMLKLGNIIDKKVDKLLEKESCCSSCNKEYADYIVSGDVFNENFKVENILTWSIPEARFPSAGSMGNYWIAPNEIQGEFVLKFDQPRTVDTITIVNAYNFPHYDRGTNEFKVYLADSEYGPWTEVLHDFLEDPRNTNEAEASVPPRFFNLTNPICGQYVRFQIISWYGVGGGLQYFSTCPLKCEDDYYPFLNMCYQLVEPEYDISWNDANFDCKIRRGQLASIPNAETNDFISSLLPPNAKTYIGLIKDGPADNDWTWTDGSPFGYVNFGAGQPSGDGFCGAILEAKWNDLSCTYPYPGLSFICQNYPTY